MKLNKKFYGCYKFVLAVMLLLTLQSNVNSATVTILVSSNQFTPSNVNVNLGDSIKFQWVDGFHTTTCDGIFSGTSLPPGAATWDQTMSSGSPMYIYRVTVPGTYNYVCIPHSPGMAGTIVATGASSIFLSENFDYPAGDSSGAHGWVSFSGGSTNVLSVTAPGLVYAGYPLSNIGNAATVQTTGQDAYKNMTDSATSNSLYVSFMVNVTSAQTASDYFLALLPPTSTTNYTARFYAKDTTGGVRFGISKSTAGAGGIFYSNTYSLATTYLVVIKYDFNTPTPTDAIIKVFIFATGVPPVEPVTATIGPVSGTANDNTLGRVALRQGTAANAPVVRVDGIRAATNWSDISTGIQQNTNSVSNSFSLSQNYPNPFNPSTTINFSIPERGFVNLVIYNSLGQIVESLVNSNLNSGSFNYTFNGSNLNSGVYFYKLTYAGQMGNGFTDTKKFILLK